MICPNCNSQVPEGGFFCPECGMRMTQSAATVVASAATEAPSVHEHVVPQPEVPAYSAPVHPEPELPADPPAVIPEVPAKPKKEKKVKEKKVKEKKPASGKKTGFVVLTVVLVVLLLATVGLNVWQYMRNADTVEDLENQLSAQEKTLAENDQTIKALEANVVKAEKTIEDLAAQVSDGSSAAEALNEQIADLNAKLQNLEKDLQDQIAENNDQMALINVLEPFAMNYDAILSELTGYDVGYAADHFCADTGILVLRMSDKTGQFYLTAHWSKGGTVSMELSSYAADVNFDNDSWENGTTMTVTAQQPGVCVATFTNDIDDNSFKVLIIVTE